MSDNSNHKTSDKTALSETTLRAIANLIQAQTLPDSYVNAVSNYLAPIAYQVKQLFDQAGPVKLGIQGSQGSGKSTAALFVAKLLELEFGLTVAVCSIDDFYLTREQRQRLARDIHPLLATRGVPGTHDTALINEVFNNFDARLPFDIPVFEKQYDDRALHENWISHPNSADVLLFEGWCVGLIAEADEQLVTPCNALEETEDTDQVWRKFVNQHLKDDYQTIFARLDLLVALQAPSFDCVYDWRQLQERKLIASSGASHALKTFNADQLTRFIAHFQRLTEHGLSTMPNIADFILSLQSDHSISKLITRKTGGAP